MWHFTTRSQSIGGSGPLSPKAQVKVACHKLGGSGRKVELKELDDVVGIDDWMLGGKTFRLVV